jgi:hypothetical protein
MVALVVRWSGSRSVGGQAGRVVSKWSQGSVNRCCTVSTDVDRQGVGVRMTTAAIAGGFGLVGTLLGSVIAFWAARQTAERADRRALGLVARGEYRLAVTQFASAALAYQQAAMNRWHARRDGNPSPDEVTRAVYQTRTGAWHSLFELQLSTDDQELAQAAQAIIGSTRNIEKSDDEAEMWRRAQGVRQGVADLVRRARGELRQR